MTINKKSTYSGTLALVVVFFDSIYFYSQKQLYTTEQIKTTETGDVTTIDAFELKQVTKTVTLKSVSSEGNPMTLIFSPCASADAAACFGSGRVVSASQGGVTVWSLVSTGSQIYLGLLSTVGGKWPYSVQVDFGDKLYSEAEYKDVAEKITTLFIEQVQIGQ
jgi:hypothetical protein